MNIKEFLEDGLFDIFNLPQEIRFVIRSNLIMLKNGNYNDVHTFIMNRDIGDHEVLSAKLNFLTYTMDIEIR